MPRQLNALHRRIPLHLRSSTPPIYSPVLSRSFGDEEINVSVIGGDEDDDVNQLFFHVDVTKPRNEDLLMFLCALYPDALGIHSVSVRPKTSHDEFHTLAHHSAKYTDLDEGMRDAFHSYIEERGVGESLFPFLQAWLYVKEHRNLMRWFKSVGSSFVKENK